MDTAAQVTAVGEDGTLEVTIYSGTGDLSDYATVDLSGYTATEETKTLAVDDAVSVYTVENGILAAADLSDIAQGDMIVFTEDGKTGALTQIVCYIASDGAGSAGDGTGTDSAGDSSNASTSGSTDTAGSSNSAA